ncbi:hypothetical protein [Paraburkholderia sp. J76]|uniref:hypothetical protein n=1 Tax=Paraburkholderia sp. J76 TaxID=2805439 RepID=UPI002ABDF6A0|nr:hypothetical protein [Paraburkholderia sp. J76]
MLVGPAWSGVADAAAALARWSASGASGGPYALTTGAGGGGGAISTMADGELISPEP